MIGPRITHSCARVGIRGVDAACDDDNNNTRRYVIFAGILVEIFGGAERISVIPCF